MNPLEDSISTLVRSSQILDAEMEGLLSQHRKDQDAVALALNSMRDRQRELEIMSERQASQRRLILSMEMQLRLILAERASLTSTSSSSLTYLKNWPPVSKNTPSHLSFTSYPEGKDD